MVAYLIAEIDVTDAAAYEPYKKAASESIARHGGKYIARGGKTVSLEGAAAQAPGHTRIPEPRCRQALP